MPNPLSTTLLAIAFMAVLIGSLGFLVLAGAFAGAALAMEFARFWIGGAEPPPTTEVLVRSGEQAPEEQGRTTLLRG